MFPLMWHLYADHNKLVNTYSCLTDFTISYLYIFDDIFWKFLHQKSPFSFSTELSFFKPNVDACCCSAAKSASLRP